MDKISLTSLQRGAVVDLFDEELKKVLANIEDDNTSPNATRGIAINIAIKPDKTRRSGEVKVQVKSTLCPVKPSESFVFFDRDENGEFIALDDSATTPEFPELREGEKAAIPFPKRSAV